MYKCRTPKIDPQGVFVAYYFTRALPEVSRGFITAWTVALVAGLHQYQYHLERVMVSYFLIFLQTYCKILNVGIRFLGKPIEPNSRLSFPIISQFSMQRRFGRNIRVSHRR